MPSTADGSEIRNALEWLCIGHLPMPASLKMLPVWSSKDMTESLQY